MINFLQMLLTGRNPSGDRRPLATTADGVLRTQNEDAISPVLPGTTPPADTSGEFLWLNTNPGAEGLYFYDASRSKWLETNEIPLLSGDDAADNQVMRFIGVNTPGDGAGLLLPQATDLTITRILAHARAGLQTKSFDLRRRVPGGATTVLTSFTLAASGPTSASFIDEAVDVDAVGGGGAFFDVFAEAAGGSSQDVTIQVFARRRGA